MTDGRAPRRRLAALRLLVFLLLLAAGSFGAGFAWRALSLPRPVAGDVVRPLPMLGTSTLLLAVGLLATWATLRWMERRGLRTVGLGASPAPLPRAALGFLAGGLTPALVLLAYAATGVATVAAGAPDLARHTLPMLVGFLFVSCSEEIALRGYFMQAVAQLSRPWIAALASGSIFGLIHAGNPGANPAGLILTGLNGVLLAFLVIRTGSLWLACGYHAGWNVTASVFFGMRDSGLVHPGALAVTTLKGPEFLTGGDYGFEASWLTGGVEALVLAALLVVGPRLAEGPEAEEAREYYRGRTPAVAAGPEPTGFAGLGEPPVPPSPPSP